MLIESLLRLAGSAANDRDRAQVLEALLKASDQELQWALDAGLGPQLHSVTVDGHTLVPDPLGRRLLGADLTARVLVGDTLDCAEEVVHVCDARGIPVTLLKGVSVCGQLYPQSHFRPLTDADLLVPAAQGEAIESALVKRGYRYATPVMGPDRHHGEPLYHPKSAAKVEIHTALFSGRSRLANGRVFSSASLQFHSVAASFRGHTVLRLRDELQLVYIAANLCDDLTCQPIHPSFVTPMVDAVRLLATTAHTLDWDLVSSLVDNEVAAAALYVLLHFLRAKHLAEVPLEIIQSLAARQHLVRGPELWTTRQLLEDYLVRGRPFPFFNSWHLWDNAFRPGLRTTKVLRIPVAIAFPPTYTRRYEPGFQLRRMVRWLSRLNL